MHSAPSRTITLRIADTDPLADIRPEIFPFLAAQRINVAVEGVVDEATDTFDVPAAPDAGLDFAGGLDGVPFGVTIDEVSEIIDVTYDPGTNTLAELLAEMEAAGLQPEYRGNVDGTESPEPVGWVRTVGPITATEAAAASNIFDVFEDGEAPYVGIRGSYSAADLDWSVRGLPTMPGVQASVLLPISGSPGVGWRLTLKESLVGYSTGIAGDGWRLIREARVVAVAARAASFVLKGILFTATATGIQHNDFALNFVGRVASGSFGFVGSDLVRIPAGTTIAEAIVAINSHFSSTNVPFVGVIVDAATADQSIISNLETVGAISAGGLDASPGQPPSATHDDVEETITLRIASTDTLVDVRPIVLLATTITTVGVVDEAADTFDVPAAPDAGVPFAGGVNEIPLGVSIDLASKLIDLRYDPAAHTLADLFSEMETAALSPAYRGGAAATDAPEATGWVRTVGPITAAGAAVGTGSTTPALTGAQIKQRYEANANTNAFTNAEQTKLTDVEANATGDQTGSEIKTAYEGESDTNAFTNALKAKLDGITAAATALALADVLGAIFAGTNITIDDSVPGRITIASTASSSYPAGAGSVTGASFAEDNQNLTLTVTGGDDIVVPLGIFITSTEMSAVLLSFVKRDGVFPFTHTIAGITPVADADLSTKKYVDDADALKASLTGAAFTGAVTSTAAPLLPSALTRKDYVETAITAAINALVDSSPGALNTLNELAAALSDDPNFATTITNLLAEKAALVGAVFTGATGGISPVGGVDFVTLDYFRTHRNVSPIMDDLYFGTSDDAIPIASELTIAGANSMGTIPAYAGSKHLLIARVAAENDISVVTFSDDAAGLNQIGAFTKYGSTLMPQSEPAAFDVWVSNQALAQASELVITVS